MLGRAPYLNCTVSCNRHQAAAEDTPDDKLSSFDFDGFKSSILKSVESQLEDFTANLLKGVSTLLGLDSKPCPGAGSLSCLVIARLGLLLRVGWFLHYRCRRRDRATSPDRITDIRMRLCNGDVAAPDRGQGPYIRRLGRSNTWVWVEGSRHNTPARD